MRTSTLIATTLVLASFIGCGAKHEFRAGAAVVDITPQREELPIPLIGGLGYNPTYDIHDSLSARALAFESGGETVTIVVIDSCFVLQEVMDDAKQRASAKTGIPVNRILMSATHTHSAPPASPNQERFPGETSEVAANVVRYSERVRNGVTQAIIDAHARLAPAEIGWGSTDIPEELFNRRWFVKEGAILPNPYGEKTDKVRMNPPRGSADLIEPAGPTDPELYVVSVRSREGVPLALWATYSLHYVGGVPDNKISADYFGEFARRISAAMRQDGAGDDFVGILANGTSGDVNNVNFRQPGTPVAPFERIHQVADRVARGAYETYKKIQHRHDVDLAMIEKELTLELRKPTPEGYEAAKKVLAGTDDSKLPRFARTYAQRAVDMFEGPATADVKLQTIRIGSLAICTIPFEAFAEIGLEIKERSPFEDTFTVELANGAYGYLPTPRQHEVGGYETWLGSNSVQKDASVKITEQLLAMLGELRSSAH